MRKAMIVALLAALSVGASAQTRHYATSEGVVTALPGGDKLETRLVEVVPVIRVMEAPMLYTLPVESRVLYVRPYDSDTADTSDDLYYVPREVRYETIYETRTTTTERD